MPVIINGSGGGTDWVYAGDACFIARALFDVNVTQPLNMGNNTHLIIIPQTLPSTIPVTIESSSRLGTGSVINVGYPATPNILQNGVSIKISFGDWVYNPTISVSGMVQGARLVDFNANPWQANPPSQIGIISSSVFSQANQSAPAALTFSPNRLHREISFRFTHPGITTGTPNFNLTQLTFQAPIAGTPVRIQRGSKFRNLKDGSFRYYMNDESGNVPTNPQNPAGIVLIPCDHPLYKTEQNGITPETFVVTGGLVWDKGSLERPVRSVSAILSPNAGSVGIWTSRGESTFTKSTIEQLGYGNNMVLTWGSDGGHERLDGPLRIITSGDARCLVNWTEASF